jgi:glycosyltransferase involved in cell wall biosynthesis
MGSIRVSIIIPNYNQAHFIRSSIKSALNQSYSDNEIIIVDDGSTDNSREIINSFGDLVRYIWQENKGLAGARNTGILAAQGDLIGLLDADDELYPTYLEKMVDFANRFADASVYYCRAQAMDIDGNPLPQVFGGPPVPQEEAYQTLLRANFIIPSTILMRRSDIMKAGLFDQNLRSCEDWDLWLRLLPSHKIIGINDVLVMYRIHGSSLSNNPAGMQNATRMVIEKHFGSDDGHPETWAPDKRRAYGGMYRYHAITTIQRQEDWESGVQYLVKGFKADPFFIKRSRLVLRAYIRNTACRLSWC